jgi:death-on-curing protein
VKTKAPLWIEERDVVAIHDRLLVLHSGAQGLRDRAVLQSALARPLQHFAYAAPRLVDSAALYTAGIIRNHPFVDGNKRTGFVLGVLFLELNGFDFKAREEDATRAVFDLAAGKLDEVQYAAWLHANIRRRHRH